MLRGIKKAFSKGHAPDVEALRGTPSQREETIPVRPRAKSIAAAKDLLPNGETTGSAVTPSLASPNTTSLSDDAISIRARAKSTVSHNSFLPTGEGTRNAFTHSSTDPSNPVPPTNSSPGGQANAWDSRSIGDPTTALRNRSNAPPLSGSLSASTPTSNNQPASAVSNSPSPPTAPAAWGVSESPAKDASRPSNEKETLKHQSKLTGLFRSGSKSTRSKESAADESTSVESAVQYIESSRSKHQEDDIIVIQRPGAAKAPPLTWQAQTQSQTDLPGGSDYTPAERGGAVRTGSLMATPPNRKGPTVMG